MDWYTNTVFLCCPADRGVHYNHAEEGQKAYAKIKQSTYQTWLSFSHLFNHCKSIELFSLLIHWILSLIFYLFIYFLKKVPVRKATEILYDYPERFSTWGTWMSHKAGKAPLCIKTTRLYKLELTD